MKVNFQFYGILLLYLLTSPQAEGSGSHHRNSTARRAFEREYPCPSTGVTRGSCPGFVIDHIIPLCKHGADDPSNMQWQTIKDAKAKDRWECKP